MSALTAHREDLTRAHLQFRQAGLRTGVHLLVPPVLSAGPPLVFLHDALGCSASWRRLPARLCMLTGRPALLWERHGHGLSAPLIDAAANCQYLHEEAALLDQFLQRFSYSPAILIGHSDGATIALLQAARRPGTVAAVVSIAAHVLVEKCTRRGVAATAQQWPDGNLARQLRAWHGAAGAEALYRRWHDTWLLPAFSQWNIVSEIATIRAPLLLMQGGQDEYGTQRQIDALMVAAGGPVSVKQFPASGHFPQHDQPEETVAAIVAFLTTLTNGR